MRLVFVFFSLLFWLSRCAYQPSVCPAYQSAYIHDKDALRKKFSYFVNDSAPKVYAVNKTKYLIIEPTTYKKKERSLQTVEKRVVNVSIPDSLKPGYVSSSTAFVNAERNVYDSTSVIRVETVAQLPTAEEYKITKERELLVLKYNTASRSYWVDTLGYNTEQDNYMWYLRHVLVLPDARLAALEAQAEKPSAKAKKAKANKEGGLFKKKPVKKDTVEGFTGTTSATILPGQSAQKKAKKKREKNKPVEAMPAKKEEQEDDGF